jgi:hypothetical protein
VNGESSAATNDTTYEASSATTDWITITWISSATDFIDYAYDEFQPHLWSTWWIPEKKEYIKPKFNPKHKSLKSSKVKPQKLLPFKKSIIARAITYQEW